MLEAFREKAGIIAEIADGNLDQNPGLLSEDDTLGHSLITMVNSLNELLGPGGSFRASGKGGGCPGFRCQCFFVPGCNRAGRYHGGSLFGFNGNKAVSSRSAPGVSAKPENWQQRVSALLPTVPGLWRINGQHERYFRGFGKHPQDCKGY